MAAMIDLRAEARAVAPTLDYDRRLAEAAQLTWRGRMVNEHMSAAVFEGLAEQLDSCGLAPEQVAASRGFAREERHHGVLCGSVVEALGGDAQHVQCRRLVDRVHERIERGHRLGCGLPGFGLLRPRLLPPSLGRRF